MTARLVTSGVSLYIVTKTIPMAPSPLKQETDLVNFSILVNGKPIDSTYLLLSVSVVKEVNKIPYARIQIADGDGSAGDFIISGGSTFVPGNILQIKAGYQEQSTVIFSGIIIKHAVKILDGNMSALVIEAQDTAVKMTIGRKNAYFTKLKDSDLISRVVGSYSGLSCEVDPTVTVLENIVQYYATDWDFLLCRADASGMVVLVDQNKVSVKKVNTSQTPTLSLKYGDSIIKFDLEMDARNQLSAVHSSSWDASKQAIIQAASNAPGVSVPGNISTSALASVAAPAEYLLQSSAPIEQDSLQAWANAASIKSVMSKICGTISFQGNASANPGTLVEIDGLGARFNGNAYVSAVNHTIKQGNWITEIAIGIPPMSIAERNDHIMAPAASGLLPGIQGLQIGVVSKIDADPDNQFRVQVKIPIIDASETIVWARLSTFYTTTGGQGSYFYPEVGDEVILGFLNDDPRYAVILGALYSSINVPPYTPDEKNTMKAIVTRSGIKIEMNDDKGIVTIQTPQKNSITLSDDQKSITIVDQNNNTITMSSSGISINSAGDINIKAQGKISTNSGSGTSITASGDAQISGLNFSAQAQMQATVQGSASAQLTASGEVTVKGSIVMIN